jgi:hypothetical protein
MLGEAVFESAVCSATNLVLDSKNEVAQRTSGLLLLGPDIPIRDAQGKSDWWSPMAGRAVKLWRRVFDVVSPAPHRSHRKRTWIWNLMSMRVDRLVTTTTIMPSQIHLKRTIDAKSARNVRLLWTSGS